MQTAAAPPLHACTYVHILHYACSLIYIYIQTHNKRNYIHTDIYTNQLHCPSFKSLACRDSSKLMAFRSLERSSETSHWVHSLGKPHGCLQAVAPDIVKFRTAWAGPGARQRRAKSVADQSSMFLWRIKSSGFRGWGIEWSYIRR